MGVHPQKVCNGSRRWLHSKENGQLNADILVISMISKLKVFINVSGRSEHREIDSQNDMVTNFNIPEWNFRQC